MLKVSNTRIILSYITWWTVWTGIETYVLCDFGIRFPFALLDSVINSLLLALVGLVIFNTLRFYQPARDNLFYLRLWALLLAITATFAFNFCMKRVHAQDEAYLQFLSRSFSIRFCYNLLMVALLTLINAMWFYFRAFMESDSRKVSAEKLAKEAELASLRQQLQPHFLFNSLNSISALAGSRPEQARKMIQQLSDFLRGTLKKDDQQLSLREELQHLELYLEIEKVRFGHRLSTEISTDEESLDLLLPSLLLQPIVENAIKFGLYDTTGDITIRITAAAVANDLVVTVQNPFDRATAQPAPGTGFGLSSVRRRLYLLFSRNDLLHTHAADRQFITTVKIPQP